MGRRLEPAAVLNQESTVPQFTLGSASLKELKGVHPDLVAVVKRAIELTVQDFSDHLPMALVALDRLGASDARLAEFSERYSRSLVPVRAEVQTVRERYGADSDDDVVARHLPRFVPGIGSAAFHCVIRLAYAIEARHGGQVAAALAYWEMADEPSSAGVVVVGLSAGVLACGVPGEGGLGLDSFGISMLFLDYLVFANARRAFS